MCAAILALQAVVLFLAGVVAAGLDVVGLRAGILGGLVLAVLCLLAAGMLRRPAGYVAGWAVQLLSLGLGFVVPTMFFLGIVFGGLWTVAYNLGTRIDEERAERVVLEQQWRLEHGE